MNPVILVTGAGKGIGLEIARRFLSAGAYIAYNDRTPDLVRSGLERLEPGSREYLLGCPADVSDAGQVNEMIDHVIQRWGRIDVVVNNAGIYPSHLFLEMSEREWDQVMDVNVKGTFLVSQAAARRMVALGIRGQIINISSGSYHSARIGSAHYCASKAACIMLTKVMAMELAQFGIRVNSVAPGLIDVNSNWLKQDYVDATIHQIPVGRLGLPQDVAEVVFHLASISTDYMTGAVIAVDGGLALGRYGIPHN